MIVIFISEWSTHWYKRKDEFVDLVDAIIYLIIYLSYHSSDSAISEINLQIWNVDLCSY